MDAADKLQLRLCIIAHTGSAVNRGLKFTENVLRRHFIWPPLTVEISDLIASCIRFLPTFGGESFPRPFGPVVHGDLPIPILQFVHLEMDPVESGDTYVLLLRDDH